jgi:hypothetical protein
VEKGIEDMIFSFGCWTAILPPKEEERREGFVSSYPLLPSLLL